MNQSKYNHSKPTSEYNSKFYLFTIFAKSCKCKENKNYFCQVYLRIWQKVSRLLGLDSVEYGNFSQISIDCLTILLNNE